MASPKVIRIASAGDEAVLVEFGAVISRELNRRVRGLAALLPAAAAADGWLVEVVPAYSSLLVRYRPEHIAYLELLHLLHALALRAEEGDVSDVRRIDIPVKYGGADGPDLAYVAEYTGLGEAETVRLHSAPTYVVYMLGFTPGFCYLGDLPRELAAPRRATPRLALPAGAVAIGGMQTGVYSLDNSPGGWRWIGRTDMVLWDAERDPPFALRAGDEVRFVPV